jgi:hypothetical protein
MYGIDLGLDVSSGDVGTLANIFPRRADAGRLIGETKRRYVGHDVVAPFCAIYMAGGASTVARTRLVSIAASRSGKAPTCGIATSLIGASDHHGVGAA